MSCKGQAMSMGDPMKDRDQALYPEEAKFSVKVHQ